MNEAAHQVFLIGCGPDGTTSRDPSDAMGFKAFNLARMAELGVEVPAAFVLGTRYCRDYLAGAASWPMRRRRSFDPASGNWNRPPG